jgi:predicted  nucleic acid-binding Zn-ribbon protein
MSGLPRCYPDDVYDEEGETKEGNIAALKDQIREADTHARLARQGVVKPRKDADRERVRLEMALEKTRETRTAREQQRDDWLADHDL